MLYFEEEEEEYSFLLQPRAFSGLPAVGGGKGPLPNICHTYPIMMKLGTVLPYLKKIQKIYQSCDTPSEFC